MEMTAQIALGVSLAACAGLRAWLPLLALGLASRASENIEAISRLGITLHPSLQWIDSTPALVVFGIATVAELLGDKFPAMDNVLDAIGTVLRPGAAALILAALSSETSLGTAATLGLLIGVPSSLSIHFAKAGLRAGATTVTMGTFNFLISIVEDVLCLAWILIAWLIPIGAAVVTLALVVVAVSLIVRRIQRRRSAGCEAFPHTAP